MNKGVIVLDDLIAQSKKDATITSNAPSESFGIPTAGLFQPMTSQLNPMASGANRFAPGRGGNYNHLLRLAIDKGNSLREPTPIQPRPSFNPAVSFPSVFPGPVNNRQPIRPFGSNFTMSSMVPPQPSTQTALQYSQVNMNNTRFSYRPPILLRKPTPSPPMPIKQPPQKAQPTVNVNFTWLTLSANQIYKEKKTKVFRGDTDTGDLRPVSDLLVNIGIDIISESSSQIGILHNGNALKRKKKDEDYIPDDDSSSYEYSSDDSVSEAPRSKRARSNEREELSCVEKEALKGVNFPVDHFYVKLFKTCPTCSFTTNSEFPLFTHFFEGHVNGFGQKPTRQCCFCSAVFPIAKAAQFAEHVKTRHNKTIPYFHQEARRYACFYCEMETNVFDKMTRHMKECSRKRVQTTFLAPTDRDINLVFRNYLLSQQHLYGSLLDESNVSSAPKQLAWLGNSLDLTKTTSDSYGKSITSLVAISSNEQKDRRDPGNVITIPSSSSNFLVCELCNGMVKDLATLFRHFIIAHDVHFSEPVHRNGVRSIVCVDCLKRFYTREGLFYHRQGTNDRCPIGRLCIVCSDTVSVYDIYEHYKTKHPEAYEGNLRGTRCFLCLNSIQEPIFDMKRHLTVVHRCTAQDSCESESPESGSTKSTPKSTLDWYKELCKCPECSLSCLNWNRLRDHLLATGHRFLCNRCSATFTTSIELERHSSLKHCIDATRICEICEQDCLVSEYVKHVKAHLVDCHVVISKYPMTSDNGHA